MNNPNNLFSMMQTGGMTSTAGGAALARALQRQSDIKKLERQARSEARRQKRGSTFGSILGTVGGLLGGAIGGSAGAAIGSGLGTRIGEGVGAGKTQQYDRSGTVFGQQAFKDVQKSSRDYTRGMGGRALLSGFQTGLSAGLTPGGGMYGQYNPFTKEGQFGLKSIGRGLGVSGYSGDAGLFSFASPDYIQNIPKVATVDASPVLSSLNTIRRLPLKGFEDGGLAGYQDGGMAYIDPVDSSVVVMSPEQSRMFDEFTASTMYPPGTSKKTQLETIIDALNNPEYYGLNKKDTLKLKKDLPVAKAPPDSLIGMQDGGYTASGVLQQAGLSPTEEQLKLFQQYDPSKMQEFQSSLQQNLLSGTRQAQQQSAGMGFAGSGAVQQTQSQQREMAASDLQRAQEASQRAFESQTLGTAADLLAGGAEILGADGGLTGTFVTELPTTNQGRVTMNGQNYIWSEEEGQYILDT